ncbi:hypothetical protein CYMTET_15944 [Cymbomonas tetramitiformis]|uniref:Uncharacterized protein n=1 Tax=Cymbomonas tetramitiformis TaxID=36881 RepID=A0AAE0L8S5_9CHLO|nr:hypothetical protein CYMTET_15944 [Cymbomonas tetramitiformis]
MEPSGASDVEVTPRSGKAPSLTIPRRVSPQLAEPSPPASPSPYEDDFESDSEQDVTGAAGGGTDAPIEHRDVFSYGSRDVLEALSEDLIDSARHVERVAAAENPMVHWRALNSTRQHRPVSASARTTGGDGLLKGNRPASARRRESPTWASSRATPAPRPSSAHPASCARAPAVGIELLRPRSAYPTCPADKNTRAPESSRSAGTAQRAHVGSSAATRQPSGAATARPSSARFSSTSEVSSGGATELLPDRPASRGATELLPVRPASRGATKLLPDRPASRGATKLLPDRPASRGATELLPDRPASRGATKLLPDRPASRGATKLLPDRMCSNQPHLRPTCICPADPASFEEV